MSLDDLYRRSIDGFADRLERVPQDAWATTTRCCPDWSIHDLVNHVVNEFRWIPPLLAGRTLEEVGDTLDGDLLGDDPEGAWRDAAREVLAAIDAADLANTVELSSGLATVEHYLSEVLSDQIIHTWDLASSIGYGEDLEPELVGFAAKTLEPLAADWRRAGLLGPPVEVDPVADPQTKLLALLGRKA